MDKLRKLIRSQFEDEYSNVHDAVKGELKRRFAQPVPRTESNRARLLGLFIHVAATRQGLDAEALASTSGLDSTTTATMLRGELPDAAYTDEMLARLATAVGYEPNVLRAMLGRASVNPDGSARI
jgi:hypothetical protein